jgi:hypothetical protein
MILNFVHSKVQHVTQTSGSSGFSKPEPPPEYEKLIQKLEGEVRQHIRVIYFLNHI